MLSGATRPLCLLLPLCVACTDLRLLNGDIVLVSCRSLLCQRLIDALQLRRKLLQLALNVGLLLLLGNDLHSAHGTGSQPHGSPCDSTAARLRPSSSLHETLCVLTVLLRISLFSLRSSKHLT